MKNITIQGAGMAGLVAAIRARELGAAVEVREKGTRPGGSMLLSSRVVWRHRELEDFEAECPDGDRSLQRLIWERLDDALEWLERLGAQPVWKDTKNPRTTGRRYDPVALTDTLVRAAGDVQLRAGDLDVADEQRVLVLATGGFPVRLARDRGLLRRSNPWSEGDGLEYARAHGAATAGALDEFYGRAMPAPPATITESDFVRLSQLYGGRARVVDENGVQFFPHAPAWHESDLAQAIASRPGGTAWFIVVDPEDERVVAAREAGAAVIRENGTVRVHVAAAVTHTLGGIRIDERTRVMRNDGTPIEGLYAAGVDAGAIASGGYASGLAQALVLGLVAAESVTAA